MRSILIPGPAALLLLVPSSRADRSGPGTIRACRDTRCPHGRRRVFQAAQRAQEDLRRPEQEDRGQRAIHRPPRQRGGRAQGDRGAALLVGALLDAVADNGTVWNLGVKALKRAEDKLKTLERETRYKPEDRQYLIDRWRELRAATEAAIGELEGARKDFAGLLRTLQTNEDFIDELLQIREHAKALEVIQKLTDGIRDASDKLKKLLTTLKTPGV